MSVKVLIDPDLKKAKAATKECLKKRRFLLIVGKCWVDYRGRASSKLDRGERLVMIKEDGALLIHRPTKYEPVNWMTGGEVSYQVKLLSHKREKNIIDGLEINLQPQDHLVQTHAVDVLKIQARRRRPSESIKIFFEGVYLLSSLSLIDVGDFFLYASEEDMKRAILIKPSLIEPGFKPISFEKKIDVGFIDVYGIDKDGKFVVVEIKRKTARREAALQLARYVKAIRGIVNREVRGVLVSPALAKGVQRLLATLGLDFRSLDPKKCAEVLTGHATKKLEDFFKYHG